MAKSFNARMADRFVKITADYAKINDYVHETAVMIAEHAKEHGDCSTAQGLVMAMPASSRREMLILWFATFTPIVVKNDDRWNAKMHKEGTKLFVPFDIEAGKAKPFFQLAEENKERPPLDFDGLLKLVERLSTQIERKIEKGEVVDEDIPTALDVARKLKGLKIIKIKPEPANNESDAAEAMAKAAAG